MALWNYCTLGKATLVLFAFDIYDADSSGELAVDEVRQMLTDVYGSAFKNNVHAKIILNRLDDLAGNRCDGVDVDSFRAFCVKHQALLYPAFEIQREIQRRILGEEFWNLLSSRYYCPIPAPCSSSLPTLTLTLTLTLITLAPSFSVLVLPDASNCPIRSISP
jgi:hypothetical protein